jgi:hypothetical protein
MQVLTIIVQNVVPRSQLGVGTSSVTFFRSMGGAIGASAFGAILTAGLKTDFGKYLPVADRQTSAGSGQVAQLIQSPQALARLKVTNPALHEGIIVAYAHAIDRLFIVAVPISLASVVAAAFIKQVKLRGNVSPVQPTTEGGVDAALAAELAG